MNCRLSQRPREDVGIVKRDDAALGPGQHRHVCGVVFRTRLQRAPGEIVERVVVLPGRSVERQLSALLHLAAILRSWRHSGPADREGDEEQRGQRHHVGRIV